MHPETLSPWPTVLALAVVLVVIIALGAVLKRARLPGLSNALPMRTVASLHLGARERLVVVEIGEQWHVLGVTTQSITPVAQLARIRPPVSDDGTPEGNLTAPNFMNQLAAHLGSRFKR